uniref:PiggyBac transposable element-derived protein domain-containing protein n=1 Tax=Astyanax mexicanus TaxID=7994 RepID=A0A8B9GTM1_ASTMX
MTHVYINSKCICVIFDSLKINVLIQGMNPNVFYGKAKTYKAQVAMPPDDSENEDGEINSDAEEEGVVESLQGESEDESEDEVEDEDEETSGVDSPQEGQHGDGSNIVDWFRPYQREKNLNWRTRRTILPVPQWKGTLPKATYVKHPVQYFRGLLSRSCIQNMVEQTNLYAIQLDPNKLLKVTAAEIEQFFGICFYMSIFGLPGTRMYWKFATRVDCVADTMSMHRWEAIKHYLHLSDNSIQPPVGDPAYDKLYKVRPLLTSLLEKFNEIPMEEHLCVDEQIVPFKGKHPMKQYNPKKPKRWGYKVFVLSDSRGLVYNFEIYTGKIPPCDGLPDIGASRNIVLSFTSIIPGNMSHKLYCDNWFTSVDLQVIEAKRKIHCVGTVRANRLPGLNFATDNEFKKRGRGAFEERETLVNGVSLRAVKWFDNRPVTLLSSFASANPTTAVERWDKKKKTTVEVKCPSIVTTYNKGMGGVDLLDSLIALYRTKIRSRKWYHRLVFHMLDLTVVEAWLLYRRDCRDCGILLKDVLSLAEFKAEVASCLCMEGKATLKRKGRLSLGPCGIIRYDQTGHWPVWVEKKGRCKFPNCSGIVKVQCSKLTCASVLIGIVS